MKNPGDPLGTAGLVPVGGVCGTWEEAPCSERRVLASPHGPCAPAARHASRCALPICSSGSEWELEMRFWRTQEWRRRTQDQTGTVPATTGGGRRAAPRYPSEA